MNIKEKWNGLEKKKKIIIIAVVAVVIIAAVAGIAFACLPDKDEDEQNTPVQQSTEPAVTATPTPTVTPTATPTPEPTKSVPKGMVKSRLTGEYIKKSVADKKPIAVMFNNLSVASPQSGISKAGVLYEAATEGGITRLMGIFESYNADRIGSLRSARHYFVSFAKEWDSIYVHVGGSNAAYDKIKEIGILDMNGIYGIGNTLVYRDHSLKAPHNAFTSKERINKAIKQMGFDTKFSGPTDNHFTFNDEDVVAEDGKAANKVSIKFSAYTTPYFVYDAKTGLYGRYQFGSKHTDYNTGKQLKFKNIIIMNVKEWTMDKKGRQDMDIVDNTGDGWYITGGKAVKIKWKKKEADNTMQFLDKDGKLLSINTGKTYIGVVNKDLAADTKFSSK